MRACRWPSPLTIIRLNRVALLRSSNRAAFARSRVIIVIDVREHTGGQGEILAAEKPQDPFTEPPMVGAGGGGGSRHTVTASSFFCQSSIWMNTVVLAN